MYVNALGTELRLSGKSNNVPADGKTGTARNDQFQGSGTVTMTGGAGDDSYNLWSSTAKIVERGGEGVDTAIVKYWGAATLADGVENLILDSAGANAGTGNRLDNIIVAGTVGADINGLGGNDVLVGGAGADIFRIGAGNGSDKVYNFEHSKDVIKLDGYGLTSFAQVKSIAAQQGADVRLSFANGEQLVIADTQLSSLHAWDFGLTMPQLSAALASDMTVFKEAGRAQNHNGWYVFNNTYNMGSMKAGVDYTSEVRFDRSDVTSGTSFTWSMPLTTKIGAPILAYPEVMFGVPPMGAYANNPTDKAKVFPVRLSELISLKADQDVTFSGNLGGFNVAYDIWFTSVPNGDRTTITNEVMVWVHKGDFPAMGSLVGTYAVGDLTANIYHTGTYTAVVFDTDLPDALLDLSLIFNRLMELGIVSPDEYLASVEFGAEVVSGSGSLVLNNFDLEVKTRGQDGTIIVKEVGGSGTTVREELPPVDPLFTPGTESLVDGLGNVIGSKITDLVTGGYKATTTLNGAVTSVHHFVQDSSHMLRTGGDVADAFFYFGRMTAADRVDGGAGADILALQGDYSAGLAFGAAALSNVETISLLSGADKRFGDTANSRYSYVLTTDDGNVAAGTQLIVNGAALLAGERLEVNGAAERDGTFFIYAGAGTDRLTGGAKADVFFFAEGRLTAGDRVDGGDGADIFVLRGSYAGSTALTMAANTITNVETITLMSAKDTRFFSGGTLYDYDITTHDNTFSGGVATINGAALVAGEEARIDARAETDTNLRLFGGASTDEIHGGAGDDFIWGGLGADVLSGGAGADTFAYAAAANPGHSTSLTFDRIIGFDAREDVIDLPFAVRGPLQQVTGGALSTGSFDADLAARLDAVLDPSGAVLFHASTGDFAGRSFLVVDGDNNGSYDAGQDYVIELVQPVTVVAPGESFFI